MYIYENPNWPHFEWNESLVLQTLSSVKYTHGKLIGRMESIGLTEQKESTISTITEDVIKSHAIEGEILDFDQVRSSVARKIGLDIVGLKDSKPRIDAIVKMTMDAMQNFNTPLTIERLFSWHKLLFTRTPNKIIIANWRDDNAGPMQVISGVIGRLKVHYEAPPADSLSLEMNRFITWFNEKHEMDYIIKAAIAHLWFVTLHPFDDGNGRIARVISDMCLARLENSDKRFYSMSSQIRIERKDYYNILEKTQKNGVDITEWLLWFLNCMHRAIENTENTLSTIMMKVKFWQKHSGIEMSSRQINVLSRISETYEHNVTSSQYANLAKCSQDTAHRDILDLIDKNVLIENSKKGRSISYMINI